MCWDILFAARRQLWSYEVFVGCEETLASSYRDLKFRIRVNIRVVLEGC